jgi:hypothetical protein
VLPASPAARRVASTADLSRGRVRAQGVEIPVRPSAPVQTAEKAELSVAGGVNDLGEAELRALLGELSRIRAVPDIEPVPVVSSGEEGST